MLCDQVATPAVGDWPNDPYPGGVPGEAPRGPWPLVQSMVPLPLTSALFDLLPPVWRGDGVTRSTLRCDFPGVTCCSSLALQVAVSPATALRARHHGLPALPQAATDHLPDYLPVCGHYLGTLDVCTVLKGNSTSNSRTLG